VLHGGGHTLDNQYTVRFAHLKNKPDFNFLDTIIEGDNIGIMGSSGQSKHNHLHIDCINGFIDSIVRLKEIGYEGYNKYTPSIKQLNYFIDDYLFKIKPVITTYFYDPEYKSIYKKDHPAYDLVPNERHISDSHFNINWNRSKKGVVLKTGYDEGGYGNYILIGFEA